MKEITILTFAFSMLLVGWVLRGASDRLVEVPRIPAIPLQAVRFDSFDLLPCPVSRSGLAEYEHACRVRERMGKVQPWDGK